MFPPRLRPRAVPSAVTTALLFLGAAASQAQSTTPAADAGAGALVVITGAREPTDASRLVADLVVIDAQRIRESTADSVEDLLRREAGLQLSRNGGPGAAAALFIRGAGASNTLVLVDGVRIGSATLGLVDLEGLSLAMIERIEVLRGPASSLYGADGSGGVVQIFTRRGEGPATLSARAAFGGYGAREASLSGSLSAGPFDLAAALSHEQLRGVSSLVPGDRFGNHNPDDDGMRRHSLQAQLGWRPADGHRLGLSVNAGRLNSQFDASQFLAPTFAQDNTPDFRSKLNNEVVALEHRGQWSAAITTTLRLSTQESDLRTGATVEERFRTRRRQLDAQVSWNLAADQRLTVAYEGLRERAQATPYATDVARDNHALVLAYAGAVGLLQVQVDARHDHSSVWGGVSTGRLGASFPLVANWRLRALAGSSFRAPSFNDLYYPGYGVATISPEYGLSVEAGVEGRWAGYEVSATVWRNRVRDLIGYEPDATRCPPSVAYQYGCARNIGRARLQGLSLNGGARLAAWNLRGTLEFLDAKDADTGARLERRAAHQATLSADYDAGAWSAGATVLRVGARPDGDITLAAATTLDLKASWRLTPQWTLQARLLNATNQAFVPARDYQSLGRQAWLALRYEL